MKTITTLNVHTVNISLNRNKADLQLVNTLFVCGL